MPVFERRHIAKVYCGATPFEMQEVELQSSIIRHERERSYEKVLKRESNRVYYSKMLGLTFLRRKTTSKKLPVLTC